MLFLSCLVTHSLKIYKSVYELVYQKLKRAAHGTINETNCCCIWNVKSNTKIQPGPDLISQFGKTQCY